MTPRYVPILKAKHGELSSLEWLSPETWRGMQPVLEVVPPSDGDAGEPDVGAVSSVISRLAERLGRFASGHSMWIDAGHLDLSLTVGEGGGPLSDACSAAEVVGVAATPVIRPNDPQRAHEDVRALHGQYGRGVGVRLSGEDVTDDPDDVDDALDGILEALGMARQDVDLLLDVGPVNSDSVRPHALAARLLIRNLAGVHEWRSITVAAGAFPADLSGFLPWQVGEQARSDADLWAEVQRRHVPRIPDFGDYAVAHPLLSTGPAFRPAPQLRYTTASHWLILKGDKRDPRGASQFYDICDEVARSPHFAGAALGMADERIADPRSHGTGNATTWRQIGTAHHLDFVVRRLTSLGEP